MDPRHGAGADPPGVRGAAVGGQRGPVAAQARPVAQRPLYRAYQQNPEAVACWKAETYPAIRAEAARVGATIYFTDEAGVRSDYHAGTTWAPVGQTPWSPPPATGSGST